MAQPSLRTISVLRRGYGRRYTDLPVDELTHQRIVIDCSGGYLRPELIDLRQGDMVYWREQERYVTGSIAQVRREGMRLVALLSDVKLMPEDFFPY
ncbi:MAG: hypothetical protein KatS3mg055_2512 [Chloroflexus sp.]|uniref:hypothetical protein n=1 Tax=Chloroflexus sp. TaxID=1904827 RepID=UPI0021DE6FD9|nr:hypothetical protein [Chloroflexus sp.]GIV89994.1 MAG: hypothetical protein KatS3mg055_2512 [Chloroflexus sp.]